MCVAIARARLPYPIGNCCSVLLHPLDAGAHAGLLASGRRRAEDLQQSGAHYRPARALGVSAACRGRVPLARSLRAGGGLAPRHVMVSRRAACERRAGAGSDVRLDQTATRLVAVHARKGRGGAAPPARRIFP